MTEIARITAPFPVTRPIQPMVERGIRMHVSAFMSGRVSAALQCYKLPLPVFVDDKMVVIESERHFIEMIKAYRHYVLKDGLTGVRGELLGITENEDHLLVSTRFTFDYLNGRSNSTDSVRYVRQNGGRLIVEMVENKSFPHHGTLAPE